MTVENLFSPPTLILCSLPSSSPQQKLFQNKFSLSYVGKSDYLSPKNLNPSNIPSLLLILTSFTWCPSTFQILTCFPLNYPTFYTVLTLFSISQISRHQNVILLSIISSSCCILSQPAARAVNWILWGMHCWSTEKSWGTLALGSSREKPQFRESGPAVSWSPLTITFWVRYWTDPLVVKHCWNWCFPAWKRLLNRLRSEAAWVAATMPCLSSWSQEMCAW